MRERHVKLGEELDKMIKLLTWAREKMEEAITKTVGMGGAGFPEADARKLRYLTSAYNDALAAKIRYDKAAKEFADSMSSTDERNAVIGYLKALEPADLKKVLNALGL
jgi:hypothetical protein